MFKYYRHRLYITQLLTFKKILGAMYEPLFSMFYICARLLPEVLDFGPG